MDSLTLADTGAFLREHGPDFRDVVQQRLYQDVLESRQVFPIALRHTHLELADALAWVLERTSCSGKIPKSVLQRLQQLGQDHRRHGFPAEIYPAFSTALQHGLAVLGAPHSNAAGVAIDTICGVMAQAATTADLNGIVSAYSAEVLGVQRRSRRISVVLLESGLPVDYQPGQHLPVTTSYLPGVWRMLSPALPSNDFGQMEFHIQAVEGSDIAQLMATPKPGDYWTFGSARGNLSVSGERDILMIAHGTGLAPLRAILFDMLHWQHRPRVHLFVAAEYPGELYDLMGLWNLAAVSTWLSVIPVVEHEQDAWWVGATETSHAPQGLHLQVSGHVGEVVASYGAWADREILVVGEPRGVQATVASLIAGGTPAAHIQSEAWENTDDWPRS
ncbi:FAD-binding oxidoreductase [Corynebacterium alimapuense]|nr:FAD-binding oxidoreductase [Corynebacterium alimapuense]